jgi:hypothetical protein
MSLWAPRSEDRRKATRRERHDTLLWEADIAFERGDLDGAEELKAAAQKMLEGEERRSGRERRS